MNKSDILELIYKYNNLKRTYFETCEEFKNYEDIQNLLLDLLIDYFKEKEYYAEKRGL